MVYEKLTVHRPAANLPERQRGSSACDHDAGEARHEGNSIIDLTHLARMTLGEKRLEAEVLALFERQAGILVARMEGATAAALAHTLAGSARSIGAWEVARAAQEVERAARGSSCAETASAIHALGRVAGRAQAAIKALLATE